MLVVVVSSLLFVILSCCIAWMVKCYSFVIVLWLFIPQNTRAPSHIYIHLEWTPWVSSLIVWFDFLSSGKQSHLIPTILNVGLFYILSYRDKSVEYCIDCWCDYIYIKTDGLKRNDVRVYFFFFFPKQNSKE